MCAARAGKDRRSFRRIKSHFNTSHTFDTIEHSQPVHCVHMGPLCWVCSTVFNCLHLCLLCVLGQLRQLCQLSELCQLCQLRFAIYRPTCRRALKMFLAFGVCSLFLIHFLGFGIWGFINAPISLKLFVRTLSFVFPPIPFPMSGFTPSSGNS